MFRFTIRDVLWLTVVVALVAGWLVDRQVAAARYRYLLKEFGKILPYAPPEYLRQFPITEDGLKQMADGLD